MHYPRGRPEMKRIRGVLRQAATLVLRPGNNETRIIVVPAKAGIQFFPTQWRKGQLGPRPPTTELGGRPRGDDGVINLFRFHCVVTLAFVFAPALAMLNGCASAPEINPVADSSFVVREVGRSLYCKTTGIAPQVQLLNDAAAAWAWQEARGLSLSGPESLANTPHAIIEMGAKPTGGFGLAVSRAAELRDERVILSAIFFNPDGSGMVTQALTSPCVLVELPAGRYSEIEVRDVSGAVRATGTAAEPTPVPLTTDAPPSS